MADDKDLNKNWPPMPENFGPPPDPPDRQDGALSQKEPPPEPPLRKKND